MKVGTICKLKVYCLGNKAGTLGVVFYEYDNGFQVIFENGHLDGFSTERQGAEFSEVDRFLEEVGFEESLAGYQFKTVMRVEIDYRDGLFDIGWSERWKIKAAFTVEAADGSKPPRKSHLLTALATCCKEADEAEAAENTEPEYEKCEVYADGNKIPWLKFKRKILEGEGVTVCMLSAATDYVDFSHFEYADFPKSALPRWPHGGITTYPLYVVFRKKL